MLRHNWLKMQRRAMGSSQSEGMFGNGDSKWADYKNGFGTPSSDEFLLGLEKVHQLTKVGKWELMFKAKWAISNTQSSIAGNGQSPFTTISKSSAHQREKVVALLRIDGLVLVSEWSDFSNHG